MSRAKEVTAVSSIAAARLPFAPQPQRYSRRLLRYLVLEHGLTPGARVLEVGCDEGELTRQFFQLSLEVTAFERDPETLKKAQDALPNVDILPWKTDLQRLGGEHEFDFVVAHHDQLLGGDLFNETTLRWTANLVSCIRPGGSLLVLVRHDPQNVEHPQGHLPSCYGRLFSRFPGAANTAFIPDSLTDPRTWNWMLGRQPRSGYLAVTLHTPQQPLTRFEWHQLVTREVTRPQEPCCVWARQQGQTPQSVRHAA